MSDANKTDYTTIDEFDEHSNVNLHTLKASDSGVFETSDGKSPSKNSKR